MYEYRRLAQTRPAVGLALQLQHSAQRETAMFERIQTTASWTASATYGKLRCGSNAQMSLNVQLWAVQKQPFSPTVQNRQDSADREGRVVGVRARVWGGGGSVAAH